MSGSDYDKYEECSPDCECSEILNKIGSSPLLSDELDWINDLEQQHIKEKIQKVKETLRYNNGKPELSLVPQAAIEYMAKALMYGKQKYDKDNYKLGGSKCTIHSMMDSLLRHAYAFLEGEDTDPESGNNHLYHIGGCFAMMAYHHKNGTLKDDRNEHK